MVRVIFVGVFIAALGMMANQDMTPPEAAPAADIAEAPDAYEPLQGTCGDGQCQPPEDCRSCPQDCGGCCGDSRCDPPEDCRSCPQDCGPCS